MLTLYLHVLLYKITESLATMCLSCRLSYLHLQSSSRIFSSHTRIIAPPRHVVYAAKDLTSCYCQLCQKGEAVRNDCVQRTIDRFLDPYDKKIMRDFKSLDELLSLLDGNPHWFIHLSRKAEDFTLICDGIAFAFSLLLSWS